MSTINSRRDRSAFLALALIGASAFLAAPNAAEAQQIPFCTNPECVRPSATACNIANPSAPRMVAYPGYSVSCNAACLPTLEQCTAALGVCSPQATDGYCRTPGTGTPGHGGPPRPPRPPHVRPSDICEAGAQVSTVDADTCECVPERTDGLPMVVLQSVRHSDGEIRMELTDRAGHRHVMCRTNPVQAEDTPDGPTCRAPLSVCNGDQCVDLRYDPSNCGSCGHACNAGQLCSNSVCVSRESAPPTPPVPQTPAAANRYLERQIESRLVAVESRTAVGIGPYFAGGWHQVSLSSEDTFHLFYPSAGVSLFFDWPNGPPLNIELYGSVGSVDTGHACNSVTVDAGARFGMRLDSAGIISLQLGWAGFWANAPCQAPAAQPGQLAQPVTDGVAFATGPTFSARVRPFAGANNWARGLFLLGEFAVTPFGRFSADSVHDEQNVIPFGGQLVVGFHFGVVPVARVTPDANENEMGNRAP